MEGRTVPLSTVPSEMEVTLIDIHGGRGMESRLYSMGLIPGVRMRILSNNGAGPLMVAVRDIRVALGQGIAFKMMVEVNDGRK
jgi:ferrous iron transport protein A